MRAAPGPRPARAAVGGEGEAPTEETRVKGVRVPEEEAVRRLLLEGHRRRAERELREATP